MKGPVVVANAAAPKTYPQPMPRGWWLRKGHYFWYMVREFTALPLALWLVALLIEVQRASGGPGRYAPHASLWFVIFSVICLPFALYHSVTFLRLSGVIIRLKVMGRAISSRMTVGAMLSVWIVASVVVAAVLIGFGR